MKGQLTSTDRPVASDEAPDGLLLARVSERSAWDAVESLRAEMQRLAEVGEPRATFVTAIAADGREVPANHPDAEVLALGYSIQNRATPLLARP